MYGRKLTFYEFSNLLQCVSAQYLFKENEKDGKPWCLLHFFQYMSSNKKKKKNNNNNKLIIKKKVSCDISSQVFQKCAY